MLDRTHLLPLASLALAACTGWIGGLPNSDSSSSTTSASQNIIATPQIVRATNLAYTNSIRDLFPGITIPALTLPDPGVAVVYDNDAIAQAPTPALISAYQANAQLISQTVLASLGTVAPCAATSLDDTCAQAYLNDLASRAYRHPLSTDESGRIQTALQTERMQHDIPTSMDVVLQGILQSPAFLYQIEQGNPVAGNSSIAQLTGDELATRVATFMWASIPDQELRTAAEDGTLLTDDVLEKQTRRLLADPRAHDSVARMQYQWLRFGLMSTNLVKDPTLFPQFNDTVAQAMRDSAAMFVDHVFWDEGTLDAFFNDSHTFVNAALAPSYGLSGVTGTTLTLMDTNANQRGGILTQAGLLAAFGHSTEESPVLRGVFVLDRILCTPPPPPPANVNTTPPTTSVGDTSTTREKFQTQHENGACASCHKTIDGVGFGFEHYDAVGMWRDMEAGQPVDATGSIVGTNEIDGPFDGIIELNKKLATSKHVAACVASNWLQYGLGIDSSAATTAVVTPIVTEFTKTLDFRELLVAIVKSKTFRYRMVQP